MQMSFDVVEILSHVERPTVVMGLTNMTYTSLKSILAELVGLGLVECFSPTGDGRLKEAYRLTIRGLEALRLWRCLRPLMGLEETYSLEVLSRW
jgi:predicted transcriptional regulator